MRRPQYTYQLGEQFYQMNQEGKSYTTIAKETGYTLGFVRNCLLKHNKPLKENNAWNTGKRNKQTEEQLKSNACFRTMRWREENKGNHIYQITFPDGKFYIGQTKQGAKIRFNDHYKNPAMSYLKEFKLSGGKKEELKLEILEELNDGS